jgi:nucleoside-diphosphate-sugar epimerase
MSEVERLFGSNEKIKRLTNWRQAYNIDQALDETIAWFRSDDNLKLYKPDIYNI